MTLFLFSFQIVNNIYKVVKHKPKQAKLHAKNGVEALVHSHQCKHFQSSAQKTCSYYPTHYFPSGFKATIAASVGLGKCFAILTISIVL